MLYIGSDHAGFKLKQAVKAFLIKNGYKYEDLGNLKLDLKDDYPDYGAKVAKKVSLNLKENKGILVCGSAEGMGIVANKFKGVRAAVVNEVEDAKKSREHNDANILSLSGWSLSEQKMKKILKVWLETNFSGEERHRRRLKKIQKIEKENLR